MKEIFKNSDFAVKYDETTNTMLCSTLVDYVLDNLFKITFNRILELVEEMPVKKFVFDKTSLKVFNQESMVWYHIDWKVKSLNFDLKKHYKILPEDNILRLSVEMGKKRIKAEYPKFSFNNFDIKYFESVDEAIKAE